MSSGRSSARNPGLCARPVPCVTRSAARPAATTGRERSAPCWPCFGCRPRPALLAVLSLVGAAVGSVSGGSTTARRCSHVRRGMSARRIQLGSRRFQTPLAGPPLRPARAVSASSGCRQRSLPSGCTAGIRTAGSGRPPMPPSSGSSPRTGSRPTVSWARATATAIRPRPRGRRGAGRRRHPCPGARCGAGFGPADGARGEGRRARSPPPSMMCAGGTDRRRGRPGLRAPRCRRPGERPRRALARGHCSGCSPRTSTSFRPAGRACRWRSPTSAGATASSTATSPATATSSIRWRASPPSLPRSPPATWMWLVASPMRWSAAPSPSGGCVVWEYYFPFAGPDRWTSGFAQASGADALARAGQDARRRAASRVLRGVHSRRFRPPTCSRSRADRGSASTASARC